MSFTKRNSNHKHCLKYVKWQPHHRGISEEKNLKIQKTCTEIYPINSFKAIGCLDKETIPIIFIKYNLQTKI